MNNLIDITLPLNGALPVWPGSSGFQLSWSQRIDEGQECNNSRFATDSHIGTHIDAPYHFISSGGTVDTIPLKTLIGPCRVIEMTGLDRITAAELEHVSIETEPNRLLIKTDNSAYWIETGLPFNENFVALEPDAARWLVSRDIQLIGIDYLSIGSFRSGVPTHKTLLNAGIIVVEGLNLSAVLPGFYELICLPLKIDGAEGAPARAVLRK